MQHPIQVVSRRTGLGLDLIRAWERRYRVVSPVRGGNGRRLYSDQDIERLLLLRRATETGRRISDVAGMDDDALRALLREEAQAPEAAPAPPPLADAVAAALEAVEALDGRRLETLLDGHLAEQGLASLLDTLLSPLFGALGEAIRAGRLRIVHEHYATAAVRSFLARLPISATPDTVTGPAVVVTTPAGQVHELGALMASVSAAAQGWEVIYLGPNLPAEEIAAAARQRRAEVVVLSAVCRDADATRLPTELGRLRRLLPEAVILLGGEAGQRDPQWLEQAGVVGLADQAELRRRLDELRAAQPR